MYKRQIFSPRVLYGHSVKDSADGPNSLALLLLSVTVTLFSLRWNRLANRVSVYPETCKQGNWTIKVLEPAYVFFFTLHKQFLKSTL